ncbi:FAD-dependent oxidoreductase [Cupriavidus plantarum]|uniref:FAD-dependent oxidoreductase n=1 Tax=Cupriavidus plantarum TaxID=942865 RepID=UPI000F2058B8|nr:FAD-dependent oxidoreductase [Cupriavidus plantarum]RLK33613.1 glycine/D-amino acid oxidase-like deaminating enzyme [Cupriavidus plantarum]
MHIVVVGAGIAGVVTALTLAREGATVDIVEAAPGAASGASFANAGLISPGHCFSWAEPGVARVAIRSLLGLGDGIGICPPWTPSLLRWAGLFAREGTRDRWIANSTAALELAAYSRNLLFGEGVVPVEAYGGRHAGILYLYGENQQPGPYDEALLRAAGEPFERLDHDALLLREPMLARAAVKFARGVFCPNDGTGDAARYTAAALEEAMRRGVRAHFGERVRGFDVRGAAISGVETDKGHYKADAVVVAAGLSSRQLLASLGDSLPIFPVTGYSISYRGERAARPSVGAVSIPHKIAWAAFGEEAVRFTGFADIGVPGPAKIAARFRALEAFAHDVYPEIRGDAPAQWVGQRPMTPDNLPFLGASRHANLWLNCGHGAMGWTMACGSARIVSDLILGREPAIDLEAFRWDRYGLLGRRGRAVASDRIAVT